MTAAIDVEHGWVTLANGGATEPAPVLGATGEVAVDEEKEAKADVDMIGTYGSPVGEIPSHPHLRR